MPGVPWGPLAWGPSPHCVSPSRATPSFYTRVTTKSAGKGPVEGPPGPGLMLLLPTSVLLGTLRILGGSQLGLGPSKTLGLEGGEEGSRASRAPPAACQPVNMPVPRAGCSAGAPRMKGAAQGQSGGHPGPDPAARALTPRCSPEGEDKQAGLPAPD